MFEDQELKEFDYWLMFADFESFPVFNSIHLGDRNGIDIFDPDCAGSIISITVIKIWLWRY